MIEGPGSQLRHSSQRSRSEGLENSVRVQIQHHNWENKLKIYSPLLLGQHCIFTWTHNYDKPQLIFERRSEGAGKQQMKMDIWRLFSSYLAAD